jgi:7-cyano-7-deazaguanine synthase
MAKKAVVLLSRGIDSATTLAIAKAEGFENHAISFRYGQRNHHEVKAAQAIARDMEVKKHLIMTIDLSSIGGSALTTDIPVPKAPHNPDRKNIIPVTYVPARNTLFLSFGLAWAESLGASDIFIGVNSLDYSGYPDCRVEFIRSFETMANLATKAGFEGKPFHIHTPLIRMTKAEIIRKGTELRVDFSLTQSCYDPASDGRACGLCESCRIRKKGFQQEGIPDPTLYIQ